MINCKQFQLGLACLVLAAFCGLAGFLIVYHYATSVRPLEQFAIVIDAGSTQTRSSLFMIDVDVEKMQDWTSEENLADSRTKRPAHPLNQMIQVKQVSSCINGGPLAQLKGEQDADRLLDGCLKKFARHIEVLDFISLEKSPEEEDFLRLEQDSEEVAAKLALLDHRLNALVHIHLGATAGMRALAVINGTRATEKMSWIESSIEQLNARQKLGPFVNKGYIDVISGSDEAAFGWASVNFVSDTLEAEHRHLLSGDHLGKLGKNSYTLEDDTHLTFTKAESQMESIGIVELGGASSQIAFQVSELTSERKIQNLSMQEYNLELFNSKHKLATRSDLCLGMSQAILRTKYLLLSEHFKRATSANWDQLKTDGHLVVIENPCFQRGSRTNLSSSDIGDILKAPCLAGSQLDLSLFNESVASKQTTFQFQGTGDTDSCNKLLSKLLDSQQCSKYFSLCPKAPENLQPPPSEMPFVTISGYNKALQVLNLEKKSRQSDVGGQLVDQRIKVINEKLGGYPIDYQQFTNESRKFCSTEVSEFPKSFPKMQKAFYSTNCLQLVYINKILTEFYKFEPSSSWKQLNFLLFPVKSDTLQEANKKLKQEDLKNDIGWSLGLLLNVTSNQFFGPETRTHPEPKEVLYHHGATVVFLMRATVFLMLACCLIAISLIVVAIVGNAYANSCRRESYIDHSYDGLHRPVIIQ